MTQPVCIRLPADRAQFGIDDQPGVGFIQLDLFRGLLALLQQRGARAWRHRFRLLSDASELTGKRDVRRLLLGGEGLPNGAVLGLARGFLLRRLSGVRFRFARPSFGFGAALLFETFGRQDFDGMARGDELGEQLREKPQLPERRRRIVVKRPFGQRAEPRKARIMPSKKGEIALKGLHDQTETKRRECPVTMLPEPVYNKWLHGFEGRSGHSGEKLPKKEKSTLPQARDRSRRDESRGSRQTDGAAAADHGSDQADLRRTADRGRSVLDVQRARRLGALQIRVRS